MAQDLKLGLNTGYWGAGPAYGAVEAIAAADELGYDSIWTAEAYGSDALTPLAWWGAATKNVRLGTAIMQMSRAPADRDGDGRADDGPPQRRALHRRARRLRAAGRRGLVRDAVREAARPHARVRADHARRLRARRPGDERRARSTRCR